MTALVAALLLAVPAKDPGRAIARRVQAFYAQTKAGSKNRKAWCR